MVERLCQHYHCRPSELMAEDASGIFHRFELIDAGGMGDEDNDGG
jgi:hypothetical protein